MTTQKVCTLYQHLIRPLLEYGTPAWNPWYIKDITLLENCQERCLKLCSSEVNLDSLAHRRQSQDLCETYKYLHNLYKTDPNTLFSHPNRRLRGHTLKLSGKRFSNDISRHFLPNRVVDEWNKLSEDTVNAPNLTSFKRKLRSLPSGPEG